jgi:hypothetical protein
MLKPEDLGEVDRDYLLLGLSEFMLQNPEITDEELDAALSKNPVFLEAASHVEELLKKDLGASAGEAKITAVDVKLAFIGLLRALEGRQSIETSRSKLSWSARRRRPDKT